MQGEAERALRGRPLHALIMQAQALPALLLWYNGRQRREEKLS
jgi:hypothetical protein